MAEAANRREICVSWQDLLRWEVACLGGNGLKRAWSRAIALGAKESISVER